MRRKTFKCKFNPAQQLTHDILDGKYPISYGININHNAMMEALSKKKYDPKFVEWFVNFHAKLLRIQDWDSWDRFPEWMVPLLKKRAEEIYEGLHFRR